MQEGQIRIIARHAPGIIRLASLCIDPPLGHEIRGGGAPEVRRPVDAPGGQEDAGSFGDGRVVDGGVADGDADGGGDGGEEPDYFAADAVEVGEGFEDAGVVVGAVLSEGG